MIDLTRTLVSAANGLAVQLRGTVPKQIAQPPLLAGTARGLFLEYSKVGRQQTLGPLRRRTREAKSPESGPTLGGRYVAPNGGPGVCPTPPFGAT